jgi:hypothetical protein
MQALDTLRKSGVEFDYSKEEFLRHLRAYESHTNGLMHIIIIIIIVTLISFVDD